MQGNQGRIVLTCVSWTPTAFPTETPEQPNPPRAAGLAPFPCRHTREQFRGNRGVFSTWHGAERACFASWPDLWHLPGESRAWSGHTELSPLPPRTQTAFPS